MVRVTVKGLTEIYKSIQLAGVAPNERAALDKIEFSVLKRGIIDGVLDEDKVLLDNKEYQILKLIYERKQSGQSTKTT